MRQRLHASLPSDAERSLNRRMLDEARLQAARLIGLDGDPLRGIALVLSAVVSRRRPVGLTTAAMLTLMMLPGGSRLADTIRGIRSEAIRLSQRRRDSGA